MLGNVTCGNSGGASIAQSCGEVCRGRLSTATPATSLSAVIPILSHTQPSKEVPFAFTLVSADGIAFQFRVTAYMCAHSLYLRSARDVEASEGSVPVGSAQAVRDYVAYLQYSDLREQLTAELARPTVATGAAATGAHALPEDPWVGVPPAEPSLQGDGEGYDTEQSWLFPKEGDEICRDGAHSYTVQPLDCDRAYALHANRLRHWLTAAERASFRGETVLEDATLAETDGDRLGELSIAPTAVLAPAAASAPILPSSTAALPLEQPPSVVTPTDAPENAHYTRHSPQHITATSSSSSSLSSTSLTSSLSTASLEAYENAARATSGIDGGPHNRRQRTYLGEELGYGEFVALEDPDGLFFIEHVLLAQTPTQDGTTVLTSGKRWMSDNLANATVSREHGATLQSSEGVHSTPETSPKTAMSRAAASVTQLPGQTDAIVTLTACQQCRLLELISVADFMGTQSLVELCATYLAAWLMSCTDEEIVQSFLTTRSLSNPEAGAGASSSSTPFKVTGAASFKEPWIVPSWRGDIAPDRSGEATNLPLPSTGALSTSGVVEPRTETVTASSVKKRNAAALKRGVKQKSNHGGSADATAVGPLKYTEGDEGTTTALAAADCAHASLLMTDDQRLALLWQMKRDNSIIVSPY